MSDSTRTIAIGAALARELRAVLDPLRECAAVHRPEHGFWQAEAGATSIVVYRTGVGIKSARRATRQLLRQFPSSLILNTGCAGALADDLRPGDIVAANAILGPPPECERWEVPSRLSDVICELATAHSRANDCSGRVRAATVMTSRFPLLSAADKRSNNRNGAADVVEMEGAGVAQVAAQQSCAFASVRAILDPLCSDYPDLTIPPGRELPRLRDIARLALSPRQASRAVALYRNRRVAAAALAHFHRSLFAALQAGMIDLDLFGLR